MAQSILFVHAINQVTFICPMSQQIKRVGRTFGGLDSFALKLQELSSNAVVSDRLPSKVQGDGKVIMTRTL